MKTDSGLVQPADLQRASEFFVQSFAASAAPPVSFVYAGTPSSQFIRSWKRETRSPLPGSRTSSTITYLDPRTRLELRIEVICFPDFPAVEWVAYFKNTGSIDTPIISDIQALDAFLALAKDQPCRLHHANGSDCKIDDFAPLETPLGCTSPGSDGEARLASFGGRSSNRTLPFFNLEFDQAGVIGAVGWTGNWAAQFSRAPEGSLRVRAGMQATHLTLHPGEEIRTPRILLLFWQGSAIHGHNMLRQFILMHHTPIAEAPGRGASKASHRHVSAPICHAVWGENMAHQQIKKAQWWKDNDVPLEFFWIDAGWYGDGKFNENSTVFNSEWWKHVGNWWPNKTTYPDGLRPIGEALAKMGLGFVLWIEPERVFRDTVFTREHPEWLLGPIGDNSLFNLGEPSARRGLTDLVSGIIRDAGVTCYRQDFNTDPEPFWKAADSPDRVGMAEIRHIEGLYAFWDDLLARHPGLIIDNCSSGGRRIDLETISRSIPLWRSDYQCTPNFDLAGMQGQTHGLARWVPLSAGNVDRPDTYAFRSALGPGIVNTMMIYDREPLPDFPVGLLRKLMTEQFELREYFHGDFYPLTRYSVQGDVWMAWQLDRPDAGEGIVQVFRRADSPYNSARFKLHGLEPDARYAFGSIDADEHEELTGKALMNAGLPVTLTQQPDCVIVAYKKL